MKAKGIEKQWLLTGEKYRTLIKGICLIIAIYNKRSLQ